MKMFEQISFIYFERDRSDGHNNIVLSLANSSFSQTKENWKGYILEKKNIKMPLPVDGALSSINSNRMYVDSIFLLIITMLACMPNFIKIH